MNSEAALRVAMPLLAAPFADRHNWTILRLRAEIEAEIAAEVDRIGLRLRRLKQQAAADDIILLHGDESEAPTHPYLARAWAKSAADLRVPAPGQAEKMAMPGALDHKIRQLIVHAGKTKRRSDFVAHLERLDRLHNPKPGQPVSVVVVVEDNGPIHTSKLSHAALAARAHWLTVEWLPKYAPELCFVPAFYGADPPRSV